MRAVRDRAHLSGRVQRITYPRPRSHINQAFCNILDLALMHQNSRSRNTTLPCRWKYPAYHTVYRKIHIGIAQNYLGRLTAKFHHDGLNLPGSDFCCSPAARYAPGKTDHSHIGMINERSASALAIAGDHIEQPRREIRFLQNRHQLKGRY